MIFSIVNDGGPVYFETDMSRFFVEPWNSISSLAIAAVGVYFWIRFRGDFKANRFLIYVFSPLIFLGGLGSTFFHAFRVYPFFLYLDVLPIAFLTVAIAVMFWVKAFRHWIWASIAVVLSFLLRFGVVEIFKLEGQTAINVFYLFNGLVVGIPAIILLIKTKFKSYRLLVYAIVLTCLGFLFRYLDDLPNQIFAMGTHFLWHIFTALGALFIGFYLKHILYPKIKITGEA